MKKEEQELNFLVKSEETLGENNKKDIKSVCAKHKCREKLQFDV